MKIIGKNLGEIDRKFFLFDDYLPRGDRIDSRPDYQPSGDSRCFEVISYCGWHWYIAVPATTRLYTEAVAAYIGLFR